MKRLVPKRSDRSDALKTRETLIRLMKNDDEKAWSLFYDRYHSLILGFAMKRGCPRQLAEDVLQETLVALVRHLRNFQYDPGRGGFKSLLFKITESKIVDAFRREGRISQLKDSEIFRSNLQIEDDPEKKRLWEEEWERQILKEAIAQAKKRVAPRTFSCFEEIFLRGRTPRETADRLEITPNLAPQNKFKVTRLVIEAAKKIFRSYNHFR